MTRKPITPTTDELLGWLQTCLDAAYREDSGERELRDLQLAMAAWQAHQIIRWSEVERRRQEARKAAK